MITLAIVCVLITIITAVLDYKGELYFLSPILTLPLILISIMTIGAGIFAIGYLLVKHLP